MTSEEAYKSLPGSGLALIEESQIKSTAKKKVKDSSPTMSVTSMLSRMCSSVQQNVHHSPRSLLFTASPGHSFEGSAVVVPDDAQVCSSAVDVCRVSESNSTNVPSGSLVVRPVAVSATCSSSTSQDHPQPRLLYCVPMSLANSIPVGGKVFLSAQGKRQAVQLVPVVCLRKPTVDSVPALDKNASDTESKVHHVISERLSVKDARCMEKTESDAKYFKDDLINMNNLENQNASNDLRMTSFRTESDTDSAVTTETESVVSSEEDFKLDDDPMLTSVDERIETELGKLMDNDAETELRKSIENYVEREQRKSMGSRTGYRALNTKSVYCEGVENGSISPAVLQSYLDFVSTRSLTVCQRVEMELDRQRMEDSVHLMEDSSRKDSGFQQNDETKKSSKKHEKPLTKPGIITFTNDDLYAFLIEENESKHRCKNCSMIFTNEADARNHVNTHSPFRCAACDIIFPCLGDMKIHTRTVHEEVRHCTFCLYSTNQKANFEKHVKIEHKQCRQRQLTDIVCYICGVSFPIWDPLDEHMEKAHGIEKSLMEGDFQCPLCNAILRSDQSFRVHVRKHKGEYKQCSYPNCDYKSVVLALVNNHYNSIHIGKRKFCCTWEGCETRFKNRNQMKEHMNVVHYKIRKFFCETCGKGFLAKKHLTQHERIHSDSKPVACKFCDYRCRQTASLKWHMKHSHPVLDASATSAPDVQRVSHSLKRGRKATGKKTVSSTRKRKDFSLNENVSKVNSSKRRKFSSESESDSDGSCSPDIPEDSDSNSKDKHKKFAGTVINKCEKMVMDEVTGEMSSQDEDIYSIRERPFQSLAVDEGLARRSSRKSRKTERAEAYVNSMGGDQDSCDSET